MIRGMGFVRSAFANSACVEQSVQHPFGRVFSLRIGRISCLLFLLCLLAFNGYADQTSYSSEAGVHKGQITVAGFAQINDPHWFIGDYTLTYSLSLLMGEPLEDYTFSWNWATIALRLGEGQVGDSTVNVDSFDITAYPDLDKRFRELTPLSVKLAADIEFFAGGQRVNKGQKRIKPDIIPAAGEKGMSLSPGSPNWADFYWISWGAETSPEQKARDNKDAWRSAERIELHNLRIETIEWPESELKRIVAEYCKREQAKLKPAADKKDTRQPDSAEQDQSTAKANPFDKGQPSAKANPFDKTPATGGIQPSAQTNADSTNPFSRKSLELGSADENPFARSARLERERTRTFYAVTSVWLEPCGQIFLSAYKVGDPDPDNSSDSDDCDTNCRQDRQLAEARDSQSGWMRVISQPLKLSVRIADRNRQFSVNSSGEISNLADVIGAKNYEALGRWTGEQANSTQEPSGDYNLIFFMHHGDDHFYATLEQANAAVKRKGWTLINFEGAPELKDVAPNP